jgi:hypothetical protein
MLFALETIYNDGTNHSDIVYNTNDPNQDSITVYNPAIALSENSKQTISDPNDLANWHTICPNLPTDGLINLLPSKSV